MTSLNNVTCFVVGYTGAVGVQLTKALIADNRFSKIFLLGRRPVELDAGDGNNSERVKQIIIDYELLLGEDQSKASEAREQLISQLQGSQVAYCCLGTTRGKSGADGFKRVDHDYIILSAELAQKLLCDQFHLVSSKGANSRSFLLYPQVKGQVENEIAALKFKNFISYRAGFLQGPRNETRFMEGIASAILKPCYWLAPQLMHTPITLLAQAMVNATFVQKEDTPVQFLENAAIYRLGNLSNS